MNGARAASLVRTEVRLQRRHGVVAATAAVTVAWVVVLLAVPATARPTLVGWILFLDVAAIGVFVVPALAVVERASGIPAALALTRLSAGTPVAVRVAVVAVGSLLAATVVVVAGGGASRPVEALAVLGAAVLASPLASLLGLVSLGRSASLSAWMVRLPLVAVPVLVPALVYGIGLSAAPVLALSPFTGALDLLAGDGSWASAAWIATWIVPLGLVARRQAVHVARPATTGPPDPGVRPDPSGRRGRAPGAATSTGGWRRRALRSMAHVDRQTVLGDGMVLAMLAGLPLLALAVRWLGGPGATWLSSRHGLDVTPWLPLAWTFVVVVHTPTMLGAVAGLLFCEDRDAHVLPAVATTRATLGLLVGLRSTVVVVAATLAVVLGAPLAGAHHPLGAAGIAGTALAAGACAVVPMMLLAAVARDRVQGVALLKAITLPLYLPLAAWVVPAPWDATFLLVPTGWAVAAARATTWPALLAATVGGVVASAVLGRLLARRLVRTVVA